MKLGLRWFRYWTLVVLLPISCVLDPQPDLPGRKAAQPDLPTGPGASPPGDSGGVPTTEGPRASDDEAGGSDGEGSAGAGGSADFP
ncbi:MAG TPA: hypothetical protein VKY73_16305 [Polyangiaceae bacterium]|nr:hypothetical protein [Polyangiaceae bacterium]